MPALCPAPGEYEVLIREDGMSPIMPRGASLSPWWGSSSGHLLKLSVLYWRYARGVLVGSACFCGAKFYVHLIACRNNRRVRWGVWMGRKGVWEGDGCVWGNGVITPISPRIDIIKLVITIPANAYLSQLLVLQRLAEKCCDDSSAKKYKAGINLIVYIKNTICLMLGESIELIILG